MQDLLLRTGHLPAQHNLYLTLQQGPFDQKRIIDEPITIQITLPVNRVWGVKTARLIGELSGDALVELATSDARPSAK